MYGNSKMNILRDYQLNKCYFNIKTTELTNKLECAWRKRTTATQVKKPYLSKIVCLAFYNKHSKDTCNNIPETDEVVEQRGNKP